MSRFIRDSAVATAVVTCIRQDPDEPSRPGCPESTTDSSTSDRHPPSKPLIRLLDEPFVLISVGLP